MCFTRILYNSIPFFKFEITNSASLTQVYVCAMKCRSTQLLPGHELGALYNYNFLNAEQDHPHN